MAISLERHDVGNGEVEIVAAFSDGPFTENAEEKIVTFISCAECGRGFVKGETGIVFAIFSAPGAEIFDSGVYHEADLPPVPAFAIYV